MIRYDGLPPILTDAQLAVPYSPLRVTRYAWLAERWWWREASRGLDDAIAYAIQHRGQWLGPDWTQMARVAMHTLLRVGSWGAKSLCLWAREHRGKRPAPAILRTVRMAAEPAMDWSALEGEAWDDYKARVFGPLREQVYGVPSAFADRYVATRLPPIRGATEFLQERVRDIVAASRLQDWPDKQFETELRNAGSWPLARVRTQIRTETSTMFNGGRFVYMAGDPSVTAYQYHATLDLRTTDFCRAIDGMKVSQKDLQATPPFHFSCRTIMVPLFEWERPVTEPPERIPTPGEGQWAAQQYVGFGQRELVAEFRGA